MMARATLRMAGLILSIPFTLLYPAQSRAGNYETCISGQYPALCKHHILTSEQRVAVDRAERDANYRTCISGNYPALCKHNLLTSEQRVAVDRAERGGNSQLRPIGNAPAIILPPPTGGQTRVTPPRASEPPRESSWPASRVRGIQIQLRELGFDPGPTDGVPGRRTEEAVRAFQRSVGLRADGVLDDDLENQIDAALADRAIVATTKDLSPSELFSRVQNNVWTVFAAASVKDVRNKENVSQGSAVAVTASQLLTNCHVIEGQKLIAVIQGDTVHEVRVGRMDEEGDRCVLQTRDGTLLGQETRSRRYSDLQVGERVYTVGSPQALDRTFGEGIISGLRSIRGIRHIQTTAPISPGSSGGGLFDQHGNLVGITTFLLKDSQSLNFAISVDEFQQ